ncbi:RNA polymerase sigma factor [Salinarimonas rosea]|uniref:RNA polymerase sigma factor n=1 Tax=Salinarimonas rosea TaxID=552063 RepID=UPI0003F65178|nr:sigma-70 family RNA polymerase sigma factor [Salinarimonas rosea]
MPEPCAIADALTTARPRALAALLRRFRDLDSAEDAFQEACLRALATWPARGLPSDPLAWLVLVGRNAGTDRVRRRARDVPLPPEDALSDASDAEAPLVERLDHATCGDDVLRLLFVCCRPELPPAHQIALALKVVCGLSVAEIARAFLVSESAMEQRITRAKRAIAKAGICFEVPTAAEREARLSAVAAALYLLFNEGHCGEAREDGPRAGFCEEAIRLGRLLVDLFPGTPELEGLLALMLLHRARAKARIDATGALVPLDAQDRRLWDADAIGEGLARLARAEAAGPAGPYVLQAAIAAEHVRCADGAACDWRRIALLYAMLEQVQPTPVVRLNRAVAVAKTFGPHAGLALVEGLAAPLDGYLPFHDVRGALLAQLGRRDEAHRAFARALALATDDVQAARLQRTLAGLAGGRRPS